MKERLVKKLWVIAIGFLVCLAAGTARAQQFDAAFGLRTLMGTPASSATGNYFPQYIGGGGYPTFSADYLLKHNFGIGGEISWRAHQALYQDFQPFRPLFYDFNAVWAPRVSRQVAPELMAGIGAENLRFYQGFTTCNTISCTDYVSNSHFMGHFGAGLRLYVHGNVFVRPEAHLYLVHNNVEFAGPRANSFGVSIGYSFRPQD
jgi:outer membrane protein with beta-barrel domain